jgi:hypothetical protein
VYLARGDEHRAFESLERELSFESSGHLYARECCANAWYAIGALHARKQRRTEAVAAFQQALARVPKHPLANLGLGILKAGAPMPAAVGVSAPSFEAAVGSSGRSGHGWRSGRCDAPGRARIDGCATRQRWMAPSRRAAAECGGGARHVGSRADAAPHSRRLKQLTMDDLRWTTEVEFINSSIGPRHSSIHDWHCTRWSVPCRPCEVSDPRISVLSSR